MSIFSGGSTTPHAPGGLRRQNATFGGTATDSAPKPGSGLFGPPQAPPTATAPSQPLFGGASTAASGSSQPTGAATGGIFGGSSALGGG